MRVCVCVCVCLCVCSLTTVARWLTAASQQEGHGFDYRMGCCWLWGADPPQTFSAQRCAISHECLCGVCMFSPCVCSLHVLPVCVEFACSPRVHKGFPPIRNPTEKHAKKEQNTPVHPCASRIVHVTL